MIAGVLLAAISRVIRIGIHRTVKRVIIARRMVSLGLYLRRGMIGRLRQMMRGGVAPKWMRISGNRRLDGLLLGLTPHPRRRSSRVVILGLIVRFSRRRRLVPIRPRRCGRPRFAEISVRIGLADQAGEFGKRIALDLCRRMIVAIHRICRCVSSFVISISHVMCIPFGKAPTRRSNETNATGCRLHTPCRRRSNLLYRISTGASTPRTARPDARTETTP